MEWYWYLIIGYSAIAIICGIVLVYDMKNGPEVPEDIDIYDL